MNKFTVVGLCRCGCDDSFVEHVEATDAHAAINECAILRDRQGTVSAVFPGHISSIIGEPVLIGGGE